MRNRLFASFFILAITGTACFTRQGKARKDTSPITQLPLVVIKLADGREAISDVSVLSLIDKKTQYSMTVLNDDQAAQQYHERGKYGVVIIMLNKEADVLTLTELFKKYKVKKRDRTLPLVIDSSLVYNAVTSFYPTPKIKTLIIEKDAATGKKYLKIITY